MTILHILATQLPLSVYTASTYLLIHNNKGITLKCVRKNDYLNSKEQWLVIETNNGIDKKKFGYKTPHQVIEIACEMFHVEQPN